MNARDDRPDEPTDDWLRLSEPDHGELEAQLVQAALAAPRWSSGRLVERFEAGFAAWLGRAHAVAPPHRESLRACESEIGARSAERPASRRTHRRD